MCLLTESPRTLSAPYSKGMCLRPLSEARFMLHDVCYLWPRLLLCFLTTSSHSRCSCARESAVCQAFLVPLHCLCCHDNVIEVIVTFLFSLMKVWSVNKKLFLFMVHWKFCFILSSVLFFPYKLGERTMNSNFDFTANQKMQCWKQIVQKA